MTRYTSVLGLAAIVESLEILAAEGGGRPFMVRPGGVLLEPGAMWSGDAVLLSATPGTVRYARGDALIHEDTLEFVRDTYTPALRRPPWMSGMWDANGAVAFKLAPAVCLHWGPRGSVCAWLNAYGAFFADNRSDIQLAVRHTALLLEGLFALRARWTGVFSSLIAALGGTAERRLEQYVGANHPERLLGFLLAEHEERRFSLEELAAAVAAFRQTPTEEFERCLESPLYARMVRRVEETARELTPLLEKLRARM